MPDKSRMLNFKKNSAKLIFLLPFTWLFFNCSAQAIEIKSPPENPTACQPLVDNLPTPIPSEIQINIPSFWWVKEQFEKFSGKILDTWLIEPETKWVNLIVNRQAWSLLNYLERYQFINQFGNVAREKGYNIKVCNKQGNLLATYLCNSSGCQINLDASGKSGLRGRSNNNFLDQ